jgi:hypothetical protein
MSVQAPWIPTYFDNGHSISFITRTAPRPELDDMHWELQWPAKGWVPAATVLNAMTLSQITQI